MDKLIGAAIAGSAAIIIGIALYLYNNSETSEGSDSSSSSKGSPQNRTYSTQILEEVYLSKVILLGSQDK